MVWAARKDDEYDGILLIPLIFQSSFSTPLYQIRIEQCYLKSNEKSSSCKWFTVCKSMDSACHQVLNLLKFASHIIMLTHSHSGSRVSIYVCVCVLYVGDDDSHMQTICTLRE